MKYTFRRYCLVVFAFSVAGLLSVVAVNFLVDPYGMWRVVELSGFNAAKSERRNQTHLFKASDLRRTLPPVLILGSSRTAYGLDPNHVALVALGGAYNAATPGGHMTVIRHYLEFAVSSNPGRIKKVILGLDFFEFNDAAFDNLPATFSRKRLYPDRPVLDDLISALFTLDALDASFHTVLSNLKDPNYQPYFSNGQLTAIDMRDSVEMRGMIRRFEMSLDLVLNDPTRMKTFSFSEEAFSEFEEIVDFCELHQIELIVFVSPTHAAHLEAIRMRGVWEQFEAWKVRVAAVTAYWDFSGYNSITTEPLNYDMDNYWDISHYRSSVGNLVLDRMMGIEVGPELEGFGFWTTADNIESALYHSIENRQEWLKENQDLLALIEQTIDSEVSQ